MEASRLVLGFTSILRVPRAYACDVRVSINGRVVSHPEVEARNAERRSRKVSLHAPGSKLMSTTPDLSAKNLPAADTVTAFPATPSSRSSHPPNTSVFDLTAARGSPLPITKSRQIGVIQLVRNMRFATYLQIA